MIENWVSGPIIALCRFKSAAECSKGGILTFIKLPFVIKIFLLAMFEWPFYTGFTVR